MLHCFLKKSMGHRFLNHPFIHLILSLSPLFLCTSLFRHCAEWDFIICFASNLHFYNWYRTLLVKITLPPSNSIAPLFLENFKISATEFNLAWLRNTCRTFRISACVIHEISIRSNAYSSSVIFSAMWYHFSSCLTQLIPCFTYALEIPDIDNKIGFIYLWDWGMLMFDWGSLGWVHCCLL